jgi:hypothetical protein
MVPAIKMKIRDLEMKMCRNMKPKWKKLITNLRPITSCEVERSFSKYKSISVDNGQCFKIENLEQYIVCNVNTSIQGV